MYYPLAVQHGGSEADDPCHRSHGDAVHDKERPHGLQGNAIHR